MQRTQSDLFDEGNEGEKLWFLVKGKNFLRRRSSLCIGTKEKICLRHSNSRKKGNVAGVEQRDREGERGRERKY